MRVSAVAAVCLCFCAFAAAQSVPLPSAHPADLAALPNEPATPFQQPLPVAFNFAQAPITTPDAEKNKPGDRWQHFIWEAAAGFTQPNGTASDLIHLGWNTRVGAGMQLSKSFGLLGEYEFNRFGWASPALSSSGATANGNVHIWGLTLEPIWRYKITERLGGYVIVGGGFYRQTTAYTNTVPGTDCNPFFGCYPASQSAPPSTGGSQVGANGGLGFTYKSNPAHRWAYYTEVRFEWLDTSPETAAFFPVNFGIRW
jgi:hypothetical protein